MGLVDHSSAKPTAEGLGRQFINDGMTIPAERTASDLKKKAKNTWRRNEGSL